MKMHERRGTEREYTCNICGEVFRNIFPFQAHQRDVHQVGSGKRKSGSATRQAKRPRNDELVCILIIRSVTTLYLNKYFSSIKNRQDLRRRLTKVRKHICYSVYSVAM